MANAVGGTSGGSVVDVVVVAGGSVVGGTVDVVAGADTGATGKGSGTVARVAVSTSSTTSAAGLASDVSGR